jgi:hypothetical protein
MTVLANGVSLFVDGQVPEFIRSGDPNFVAFIKAYYAWLEDSQQGNVVYNIKNLLAYRDIDRTTDQFINYFMDDFLTFFPPEIALDPKKLLKNSTKFYQSKGSPQSLAFLFRVLYDLDIEVYYPKQQTIRLSDGKWQLPQAIKTPNVIGFDVLKLVGRFGTGSISNTTCVVESASVAIDPTLNKQIIELFLSNVSGPFTPGDDIIINYGKDILGNQLTFSEPIIGSISSITIDPNNQGLGYIGTILNGDGSIAYNGDPVSIIGGTSGTPTAIEAVAYVGNVTAGSLQSISVVSGGYGFQLDPNTEVIVSGGGGNNATVIVDGIDTVNQQSVIINTDSIRFKQNVSIGANNYSFANIAVSNANTKLANALSFVSVNVAPISHMNVTNGGVGYTSIPTLLLNSVYETDLSTSLHIAYLLDPNTVTFNNWMQARQPLTDLGRIVAVKVLVGGNGYSNVRDTIAVDSSIGYNASFDFVTTANGAISSVIVKTSGNGYATPKPSLFLCNSANLRAAANGTGAVLQAFGDSEGADLSLSVSQIGRILSIRLVDRGFDYVSTPLVSLRNQDITVQPIANNQFYVQTEPVWQGANVNSASYLAFVDKYDRANSVLRVYNYRGSINIHQNLISTNQTTSIVSANNYGNGKARANAEFLGGLINFPGFWLNTDGFLSADQHIQDSNTYHNYSYIVKVEKALSEYKSTLLNIIHPAGMKLLAIDTITTEQTHIIDTEFEPIQTSNIILDSGTISTNAFGNGSIVGNGTSFTSFSNGSIITISNSNGRRQSKQVINIVNNAYLIVESNTRYFAQDRLNTSNGSNIVFSNGGTSNLIANDIIQTNIVGNAQTSLVIAVNSGNGMIRLNTSFVSNSTNTPYIVYPTLNGVSYSVFSPG